MMLMAELSSPQRLPLRPAPPWKRRIGPTFWSLIAVLDHPENPPSTWHESMQLTYLNPCVSVSKPVNIPAGKTFSLRYRALAHDGEFPDGMLNQMAGEWRKG